MADAPSSFGGGRPSFRGRQLCGAPLRGDDEHFPPFVNISQTEVEEMLRRLVPGVDVTEHWSGQVIETHDGLPYIGETAERQFVATGFSGNGLTFGTLAAMMACDAATGRTNPWKELFDPGRTKIHGGLWDYIKENADYPYYMLRARVASGGAALPAPV